MNGFVTAVLLNWKRPYHLQRIIESLEEHSFIAYVVIWNNAPDIPLVNPKRIPVRLMGDGRNHCTYGRFLALAEARQDIIYVQDDDVVVRNVSQLYRQFLSHQERITAGLSGNHYLVEANKRPWLQLGWGSFFLKDWAHCLNLWIDEYGEDELLCRKADRIFTTLYGKHDPQAGDFERLTDPTTGFDSDRDANSLWLKPDHVRLTNEAVAKAMALKGAA